MGCKVSVYLKTGVVYEYEVLNPLKGREHASAIINGGYRHTDENSNELEWWPPNAIEKVKVSGAGESTKYRDNGRAT